LPSFPTLKAARAVRLKPTPAISATTLSLASV
jgi:hypothetical protein